MMVVIFKCVLHEQCDFIKSILKWWKFPFLSILSSMPITFKENIVKHFSPILWKSISTLQYSIMYLFVKSGLRFLTYVLVKLKSIILSQRKIYLIDYILKRPGELLITDSWFHCYSLFKFSLSFCFSFGRLWYLSI